jgi:hypothetical protein
MRTSVALSLSKTTLTKGAVVMFLIEGEKPFLVHL